MNIIQQIFIGNIFKLIQDIVIAGNEFETRWSTLKYE